MRTMRLGSPASSMRGFSLVELMTAVAIGLLVLMGLSTVFVNSSQSYQETRRTSEQIENGRYAIELLSQEIRHAGFFGEMVKLPAQPATDDPCTAPTDGAVSDTVNNFLSLPLTLYPAASLTARPTVPTNCAAFLTSANLKPGSDIVVVRRTESTLLSGSVPAAYFYLQTTAASSDMQLGSAGTFTATQNARRAASTLTRPDTSVAATGSPARFPTVAAHIRRYRTNIYFVAPCSVPNGGGTLCTGSADDQGKPVPTLKRLEIGANGVFAITPLVEGIDLLRVELGVDNAPAVVDPGTGLIGDGTPDTFTHAPSLTDMGNSVAARIYVLARNRDASPSYVDNKTYTLGTVTTTATNDAFKRHAYGAEARVINLSGRREIPK
jgi:type IV pilus assembly protein PilW